MAAIRERTVHSLAVVALYNELLCQRNGRCRRIGPPLIIWSGISPTYSILHGLRCAGNEALLGVLFSLMASARTLGCVQLKESDRFWEAIISSLGTIDENQPPGRPPDSCRLSLKWKQSAPRSGRFFPLNTPLLSRSVLSMQLRVPHHDPGCVSCYKQPDRGLSPET